MSTQLTQLSSALGGGQFGRLGDGGVLQHAAAALGGAGAKSLQRGLGVQRHWSSVAHCGSTLYPPVQQIGPIQIVSFLFTAGRSTGPFFLAAPRFTSDEGTAPLARGSRPACRGWCPGSSSSCRARQLRKAKIRHSLQGPTKQFQ